MAKNDIINSLAADLRAALALCGITQDSQLAGIAPDKLHRDLNRAAQYFPNDMRSIPSEETLRDICNRAASAPPEEPLWSLAEDEMDDDGLPIAGQRGLPAFQPARGHRQVSAYGKKKAIVDNGQTVNMAKSTRSTDNTLDYSHAICCAHPAATYFGAWATLGMVAACITIAYILFQLLIGIKLSPEHVSYAKIVVVAVVLYILFLRSATCSTCRIGIFSFRRYPRHRQAHHFPLLGYTIPTALSIIFCMRYRCPSCGTPQKILGRSHRRRH